MSVVSLGQVRQANVMLRHGQSIHVTPQRDHLALRLLRSTSALDIHNETCTRALLYRTPQDTKRFQNLNALLLGSVLFKGDLRMLVEVTPYPNELINLAIVRLHDSLMLFQHTGSLHPKSKI